MSIKNIVQNKKNFQDEVNVKYLFFPSYQGSDLLVISFAGFRTDGLPPKYNYMKALGEFDCHQLFILDNFGARDSYYLCENRDFKIERSIKKLIDMISQEHDIKKRISIGGDKGATAAIYYGIKYNYDIIIAGSPQFHIGSYLKNVKSTNNTLEFMAGDETDESIEFLDNIIKNVINDAAISTKIIICTGKDESQYDQHVKPLSDLLKEKGIFHKLELLNYAKHSEIGKNFSEVLKRNLSLYGSFSILKDSQIEIIKNQLRVDILTTSEEDRVAVYLYDDKKKNIERSSFSLKREFYFTIEEQENYFLIVTIIGAEKRWYATWVVVDEANQIIPVQDDARITTSTKISSKTIEKADLILNDQFYLRKNLDMINFSDGINWDYQHPQNKKAYQLSLHTLRPVSFLINAFEVSKKIAYLVKATMIIEKWVEYDQTDHDNSVIWTGHATSDRAQTLAYYYLVAKDHLNIDGEIFLELINQHADYLLNDENYQTGNYPIKIDRALIMLGLVFDEDGKRGWSQSGASRLRHYFHYQFSSNGVHAENSPARHEAAQKSFKFIKNYLKNNKLLIGKEFLYKLGLTDDYYHYITKPNGYYPMIGETNHVLSAKPDKKYDDFYDQTTGIVIFQSEKKEDPTKSTWMSFICGYASLVNKHYDDLSFTLFYNGKDIFIDSGKMAGIREEKCYMESPLAHNTITILDQDKYHRPSPSESLNKITITSFSNNQIYSYVKGINKCYKNVQVERSIIFFKPDIFVIIDKAYSLNGEAYTFLQNFNLDPHITVTDLAENVAKLQSEDDRIIVKQNLSVDKAEIFTADREMPRAIIAKKSREISETSQIEFSKTGERVYFITTIALGKGLEREILLDYNEGDDFLKIASNGELISVHV